MSNQHNTPINVDSATTTIISRLLLRFLTFTAQFGQSVIKNDDYQLLEDAAAYTNQTATGLMEQYKLQRETAIRDAEEDEPTMELVVQRDDPNKAKTDNLLQTLRGGSGGGGGGEHDSDRPVIPSMQQIIQHPAEDPTDDFDAMIAFVKVLQRNLNTCAYFSWLNGVAMGYVFFEYVRKYPKASRFEIEKETGIKKHRQLGYMNCYKACCLMPGLLHQRTYYVTEMYEKVIPYLMNHLDSYGDYFEDLQIQANANDEETAKKWDLKKADKFYHKRSQMQPLSLQQILPLQQTPVVEEINDDEEDIKEVRQSSRKCAFCKEPGHNRRKCPTNVKII